MCSTARNSGGVGCRQAVSERLSGSPGGRRKGLARYVRELVGEDGRRIADFMFGVLEDETEPNETRLKAAEWFAGRGVGKATQPQAVELSLGGVEQPAQSSVAPHTGLWL